MVKWCFIFRKDTKKAVTNFATAFLWTSQGLNLGPPDYENDKVIFCDGQFSQYLLCIKQLRI